MSKNILIVAPHPDDEILGCGGIIKKFVSEGEKVYILIVTRGKEELYSDDRIQKVRGEALGAHKIVGVTETLFLDFPAPDLDMISSAEISTAISKVIKSLNISTMFLPHRGDIHHDHQRVFSAGLVAARPLPGISVKSVFSYETLSETEWAAPFADSTFIPTYFVDISEEISSKLLAMKCFKSQLKVSPHSRSLDTIEALAKYRGNTVGFGYAEAFMTIRIIWD